MKLVRLIATSQITLKSATRNSCMSVLPNDFNASQPKTCSGSRAFNTYSQKLIADHTYSIPRFIQNYDKKSFAGMPCRNCGSFSLQVPNINDDLVNATADINEFKIFMKSKNIDHQENHACLVVTVPKYVLSTETSEIRNVPWSEVDEAVVKIHLNKTTKTFVCPELAVSGNMKLLTEFLNTWSYNRNLKKGSPEKELPVLELNRLFNPGHSVMGLEDWNRAEPIESLNETEFKDSKTSKKAKRLRAKVLGKKPKYLIAKS